MELSVQALGSGPVPRTKEGRAFAEGWLTTGPGSMGAELSLLL